MGLEFVLFFSLLFVCFFVVFILLITDDIHCSYEETGAIVAALTTSIPEHADSGRYVQRCSYSFVIFCVTYGVLCYRNWDYRFCWLRDAYFVVQVKATDRTGWLCWLRE